MSLTSQVVLVTGCSTGIGRALALELHQRGHRTFATARKPEALADLSAAGIETLKLDVNDPDSVHAAVADVITKAGRIDVLINNAGMNMFGPVLETPLSDLRAIFETNVLGLVAITQAVFPHMAARRSGRIINIGSVVGLLPTPFAAAYCSSKSAVHMLSDVMRMEVKPFGIDVVVVQPGGVKSEIANSSSKDIERFNQTSSRYQQAYQGIHKRAFASQDNPMPTEDFARELVAQAFSADAPRVIRLGTGSDTLPRFAEMPADQRDALLSNNYDLNKITA
jgi:NAD(P)-dependent dehydrogenase (short-subunit alcohol dehydrogenase family)